MNSVSITIYCEKKIFYSFLRESVSIHSQLGSLLLLPQLLLLLVPILLLLIHRNNTMHLRKKIIMMGARGISTVRPFSTHTDAHTIFGPVSSRFCFLSSTPMMIVVFCRAACSNPNRAHCLKKYFFSGAIAGDYYLRHDSLSSCSTKNHFFVVCVRKKSFFRVV